jgi:hypothetical protein
MSHHTGSASLYSAFVTASFHRAPTWHIYAFLAVIQIAAAGELEHAPLKRDPICELNRPMGWALD